MRDFTYEPTPCSVMMLHIDSAVCAGCNRCVDVCQCDVLMPAEERGSCPIVAFPGECCYCGACVMACSRNAIVLRHPLMNQAKFVDVIR